MISLTTNFAKFNALKDKRRVHLLEIAGYSRVFSSQITNVAGQQPWIQEISGGDLDADCMNGSASRNQLSVRVLDKAGTISRDLQSLIFEGAVTTLKTGFREIPQSDFATVNVMKIDKVEVAERGTIYNFILRDLGVELNNTIYQTADDGYPTSQDHKRTIVGNPMDILVDILENEIGYSVGQLNTAVIAGYKANLFPGLTMEFSLDKPPQADEFIKTELFKPFFGFGFWDYLGRYTPHFHAAQAAPVIALALTASNIQSPLPVETAGDYYNVVSYRLDYDGSNFNSEIDSLYAPGVNIYGLPTQDIIQAKGLRSPLGGALYARLVAWTIFQRYGLRPGILELDADWEGIKLELGDLVTVTHSQIKNKLTGAESMTAEMFEVHGMAPDWQRGTVGLKLLDVNYLAQGPYLIAPDGTPVWTSASPTEKATYMFIADDTTREYSDGVAGHPLFP
jgi:hypothetical protein